ncbi:MAG: TolC family protein [Candidatus Eisenbacteria bacterium]|uniref:TolC family protein n=1 Tax=Eiseniibacteriota bacterium TaxID=2212470 RepID=A0A538U331_UNCEI|nr:MAG: TolC family protein [Candidatus Eisenbacteria bacterium]
MRSIGIGWLAAFGVLFAIAPGGPAFGEVPHRFVLTPQAIDSSAGHAPQPAAPAAGQARDTTRTPVPAAPAAGQARDTTRTPVPAAPAAAQARDTTRTPVPAAPPARQARDTTRTPVPAAPAAGHARATTRTPVPAAPAAGQARATTRTPAPAAPAAGQASDPAGIRERRLVPYDDREIAAALERPLGQEDCERIALARNLTLRIAARERGKAERAHWGSYGRFHPALSLSGSGARALAADDTSWTGGLRPGLETSTQTRALVGGVTALLPTGARVDVTRDMSWLRGSSALDQRSTFLRAAVRQPILRDSRVVARSPIEDADLTRQTQESLLAEEVRQTTHRARLAYYDVLRTREIVRVAEDALHGDSALVEASQALLDAKLATRRDVLSAEIRLADDRASLASAEKDYQLALDQIKNAMGLPIRDSIQVADSQLAFRPVDLDVEQLIALALAKSPPLEAADAAIRQRQLRLRVTRNATLPNLDLTASFAKRLDHDHTTSIQSRDTDWGGGVTLTYPLFGREAAAATEIAELELGQEADRRVILEREITLAIRDAVRSLHSIAEEITSVDRSIAVAEEKLDFANTMFKLGRASNLDITDAREALLKSRNQHARRVADYHGELSALESLTGLALAP